MRQICNATAIVDNKTIAKDYTAKVISQKDYNFILKETARLSVQNRSKKFVIERRVLVRTLYDKYKLSFSQIAKLLSRDHTSIMNLYYGD